MKIYGSILAWGGIGDTLRNIGEVPHQFLFERFGIRCRVAYRDWRSTGALPHAEPPGSAFFEELVGRIPSLAWGGEAVQHRGVSRLLNGGLREAIKRLNGNAARYFPFELRLTPTERSALPEPGRPMIGIQTHLSGMRTKQWGMENWRRYLAALLEACPANDIILLDGSPQVAALCETPRITHTLGFSIAQSIALVERLRLLVSVDSWSKYPAAWHRVPQLIVVPDQRSEYPSLTAAKLVRHEFSGILGQPGNRVIGLEQTPSGPALTLGSLSTLTPDALLATTAACLAAPRACHAASGKDSARS